MKTLKRIILSVVLLALFVNWSFVLAEDSATQNELPKTERDFADNGTLTFLIEGGEKPTLTIHDNTYTFPCALQEFLDAGWEKEEGSEIQYFSESASLTLSHNNEQIRVSVTDVQEGEEDLAYKLVTLIRIESNDGEHTKTLLPGDLTFSHTGEDVKTIFGVPTRENSSFDNSYLIEYGNYGSTPYQLSMWLDKQDDKIYSFTIEYDAQRLVAAIKEDTPKVNLEDLLFIGEQESLEKDLLSYSFALEGKVYRLPTTYKTFEENGWTIDPVDSEQVLDFGKNYLTTLIKDKSWLLVTLTNANPDSTSIEDCVITSVRFQKDFKGEAIANVSMPGEVDLYSKEDDLIAAYGEPDSLQETETKKTFIYGEDYGDEINFVVNLETNTVDEIKLYLRNFINNFSGTSKSETTVTSLEEAYELNPDLMEYKMPTKMSDKLEDLTYMIEGEVYSLPTPVAAFLDEGWFISKGASRQVNSGEKVYGVYLVYKNQTFQLSVINPFKNALPLEACLIKNIRFTAGNAKYLDINLPAGLPLTATRLEVQEHYAKWLDEEKLEENTYDIQNIVDPHVGYMYIHFTDDDEINSCEIEY